MATQEITCGQGWNAVSGPGAVTITVESASVSGNATGFAVATPAEAATVLPALTLKGHDFRGTTESLMVEDGSNCYFHAPRDGFLITVSRDSAPL